jgi:hypothetical protein
MVTDTNDAEEQVLALLCGNAYPWGWGVGNDSHTMIVFERNGTGIVGPPPLLCIRVILHVHTRTNALQLYCGQCQNLWFSLEFNWLFTAAPVLLDKTTWRFNIQMTLTTRIAPVDSDRSQWLKGAALQDHHQNPPPPSEAPFRWAPLHTGAFRPKEYNLTLLRGRFIEPYHLLIKKPYPIFQSVPYNFAPDRHRYKLVFGTSPYPPREEWNENGANSIHCLDYNDYWEIKDFAKDPISRKDETWAEWLGLGWWLSPTTGEQHVMESKHYRP